MELKHFLSQMTMEERKSFAESVGTSAGHLANVSYGYKPLDEKVCVAIEQTTAGAVSRQELRPDDWHLIWPELQPKQAA